MITGCTGDTFLLGRVAGTASSGTKAALLILALIAVVALTIMVGLLSSPVLRALTPPASAARTVFTALAGGRFAAGSAALCGAGGLLTLVTIRPWPLWFPWVTFCMTGIWLACLDVMTGLVPRQASSFASLAVMVAAVAMGVAGTPWSWSLRAVLGGALCWGLFAVLWLVSRGAIGFGDVRFALPLGIAAASASWRHLVIAVGVGAVFSLAFGIAVRVLAGRRTFAYTPGLAVGFVAAAALLAS